MVELYQGTSPIRALSRRRKSIYVFFGIIVPTIALVVNYALFGGDEYDMLYTVGVMFRLPRLGYLYFIVVPGISTLFLWIIHFRYSGKRINGFIAGILFFNAIFDIVFGIAAIYRLSFILPVWFPPFCAVPIMFLSGLQALKIEKQFKNKKQVAFDMIIGIIVTILMPFLFVRQPWELMKYLPDASRADLSGMDMSHVYLDGCCDVSFEEANLSGSDLSNSVLGCCQLNMKKTNLQEADLSNTILSVVDLTQADIRCAVMTNAKIYQVDFTGADFRGTILDFHARGRIIMRGANFCGADLREILHVEGVYAWEGALYDSATQWPEDFDPAEKGMILVRQ